MSSKSKKRLPVLQARMPAQLLAEFYVAVEMMDSNATRETRKLVRKFLRKHRGDDLQRFEDAVRAKLAEMEKPARKANMKLVPGARQKTTSSKS